jgi:hypothetical protein
MRPAPLAAFAVAALLACAGGPPRFDEGAALTEEGLRPLLHTRFDRAWARPGLELGRYQRIWLVLDGIHYSDPPEPAYGGLRDDSTAPFHREALEAELLTSLRRAFFGDGAWKIAEAAGPDVLLVTAALVDVVVGVPPEPLSVRADVYLESAGEATFLLVFRDSATRDALVRFADRSQFEPATGMIRSSSLANREELRRTLDTWAGLARQRLDELRAAPPPAKEPG